MTRSPSKIRTLLRSFGLLLVAGAGVALVTTTNVSELLRRDPPRMDYTWLRSGLVAAEHRTAELARSAGGATTATAARALERAILYSRSSARRTGTQPIPPVIRAQLADYFPEHVLGEVRWSLPNEYFDLGSVVAAWYAAEGGAVTLQDTIVYSTPKAAASRYLWAHELTHALQYEELGLRDFARIYVTSPQVLEQQAWDNAKHIVRDLQAREKQVRNRTG
jgi:hypothetical protein